MTVILVFEPVGATSLHFTPTLRRGWQQHAQRHARKLYLREEQTDLPSSPPQRAAKTDASSVCVLLIYLDDGLTGVTG